MDRLTSPRCFRFLRERDGAILATAETLWVFVDFASGRPAPIPPGVAAAFPLVEDSDPELAPRAGRRGA
jgi:acyl-CoA thioester hydrolase